MHSQGPNAAIGPVVSNERRCEMLSRLFWVGLTAVGVSTLIGVGSATANVDSAAGPSKPIARSASQTRANPAAVVVSNQSNIKVSVPPVPHRSALHGLCKGALQLERQQSSGSRRREETPRALSDLFQATGGTVHDAASWCAVYLGYTHPHRPRSADPTTTTRPAHARVPIHPVQAPLSSSATLPPSQLGPVASSN